MKTRVFLARINYSLYNKYLFTASVRSDGSSKFNEDNRWGTFLGIYSMESFSRRFF